MELWTFGRYRRPCLSVDAIEFDENARDEGQPSVVLRQGSQAYRLSVDDAAAAVEIAREIATLRDSEAPLWNVARASPPGQGWNAICEFLDRHSLIREGQDDAEEQLASRSRRIEASVVETAAAVLEGLDADRRAAVAANAGRLGDRLRKSRAGRAFDADGDPFDAAVEPNFFLGLAVIELEYFRRASPLTLIASAALLQQLAHEDGKVKLNVGPELCEATSLYDLRDLEAHLWLIGQCLRWSIDPGALRLPVPALPRLRLCSGLEFMRQIEIATRTALAQWGPNPYLAALDGQAGRSAPLVAGPFIEQHHVTRRFVEIIAPLLSKRLAPPLRAMMFRYYAEELAHDSAEDAACRALGVTQAALDNAVPLPLHFAFVDALTLVAESDPVSSLASLMVIEGVFGEPSGMSLRPMAFVRENPRFRALAGEPDGPADALHHNSLSRDAFAQIAAVAPATQTRVMRRILFLLELNHRAWGAIAEFYGAQDELWLPGRLGRPLSTDGILRPRRPRA